MPESIAAVGAYFGAAGAAAGATEVGVAGGATIAGGATFEAGTAAVAAAEAGAGASAAAAGGFGGVTTLGAGAAGAAGGAGAGYLGAAGKAAAGAAASSVTTKLLAPKPPKVPGAIAMPDAQAQEEAKRRSIAEQMARRGRASTIMTDPAAGTLGG